MNEHRKRAYYYDKRDTLTEFRARFRFIARDAIGSRYGPGRKSRAAISRSVYEHTFGFSPRRITTVIRRPVARVCREKNKRY